MTTDPTQPYAEPTPAPAPGALLTAEPVPPAAPLTPADAPPATVSSGTTATTATAASAATTTRRELRKERGVVVRVLIYVAVAHGMAFFLWLMFAVIGKR
jgi:hypothetical protein